MDRRAKRTKTKTEEQRVECIRCGNLTDHELDQCDQCRRALASIPRSYNLRSRGSHSLPGSERTAPDGSTASNGIPVVSNDEYDGFKYGIDDDESGGYSDDGIHSGTEGARERRRKRPPASRSFLSSYGLQATQSSRQSNVCVSVPAYRRRNHSDSFAVAESSYRSTTTTTGCLSQQRTSETLHTSRLVPPESNYQATAPQATFQPTPAAAAADNFDAEQIDDSFKALQSVLDDCRKLNSLQDANNTLTDEIRNLRSEVQSLRDERAAFREQLADKNAEVSELKEELQMCKDEVSRAQVSIGDLEARIRAYDGLVAQIMAVRGLPGQA